MVMQYLPLVLGALCVGLMLAFVFLCLRIVDRDGEEIHGKKA